MMAALGLGLQSLQEQPILSRVESGSAAKVAKMIQSLSNFSSFEIYVFAIPAIMLGSILFLGGIVHLLDPETRATPKRWLKSGRR